MAGCRRSSSSSFARRNGALPTNAGALREVRLAESGEGCVDASTMWRDASMPIRLACSCTFAPPQEEHDRLGLGRHGRHDGSSQVLPALVRMAPTDTLVER
jgi:hypothetical protein